MRAVVKRIHTPTSAAEELLYKGLVLLYSSELTIRKCKIICSKLVRQVDCSKVKFFGEIKLRGALCWR